MAAFNVWARIQPPVSWSASDGFITDGANDGFYAPDTGDGFLTSDGDWALVPVAYSEWSTIAAPALSDPVRGARTSPTVRGAATIPPLRGALTDTGDGWARILIL
jgi:hypothetical protein